MAWLERDWRVFGDGGREVEVGLEQVYDTAEVRMGMIRYILLGQNI